MRLQSSLAGESNLRTVFSYEIVNGNDVSASGEMKYKICADLIIKCVNGSKAWTVGPSSTLSSKLVVSLTQFYTDGLVGKTFNCTSEATLEVDEVKHIVTAAYKPTVRRGP